MLNPMVCETIVEFSGYPFVEESNMSFHIGVKIDDLLLPGQAMIDLANKGSSQ